ncbi:MAG: RyR domain-containing protein [Gemmatimonadales bacterium]
MKSENAALERIAQAIHARYLANQRDRKPPSDPAMQPWEALSETLKESNRDQARDIGNKLEAIRCRIVPLDGSGPLTGLTAGEVEHLSILEHERWVEERRRAGWTLGPVRDLERKVTPYLVSWEELAEEIREYDREAVRAIPEVLAEAGFAMVRADPAPRSVSDAG